MFPYTISIKGKKLDITVYSDKPTIDKSIRLEYDYSELYIYQDKIHRNHTDGPAIIYNNGMEKYYNMGLLHRPSFEGPAVLGLISNQYFNMGLLHRPIEEGPAFIYHAPLSNPPIYYLYGERIEKHDIPNYIKDINNAITNDNNNNHLLAS